MTERDLSIVSSLWEMSPAITRASFGPGVSGGSKPPWLALLVLVPVPVLVLVLVLVPVPVLVLELVLMWARARALAQEQTPWPKWPLAAVLVCAQATI